MGNWEHASASVKRKLVQRMNCKGDFIHEANKQRYALSLDMIHIKYEIKFYTLLYISENNNKLLFYN